MAAPAEKRKRPLNPRIEPATWNEHEAYVREQFHQISLEELLKELQDRGLPVSKHQLTYKLSEWNLKKYKARLSGLKEASIDENSFPQTAASSPNSKISATQTKEYATILPKPTPPDNLKVCQLHAMPTDGSAICPFCRFLTLHNESQSLPDQAEAAIFGTPDARENVWKSLDRIGWVSAAAFCSCLWWTEQVLKQIDTTDHRKQFVQYLKPLRPSDSSLSAIRLMLQRVSEKVILESVDQLLCDPEWSDTMRSLEGSTQNKFLIVWNTRCSEMLFEPRSQFAYTEIAQDAGKYWERFSTPIRLRVQGVWLSRLGTSSWKLCVKGTHRMSSRDLEFEADAHTLVPKLISLSSSPTSVDFETSEGRWIQMTPFEAFAVGLRGSYFARSFFRKSGKMDFDLLDAMDTIRNNTSWLHRVLGRGEAHLKSSKTIQFADLLLNLNMRNEDQNRRGLVKSDVTSLIQHQESPESLTLKLQAKPFVPESLGLRAKAPISIDPLLCWLLVNDFIKLKEPFLSAKKTPGMEQNDSLVSSNAEQSPSLKESELLKNEKTKAPVVSGGDLISKKSGIEIALSSASTLLTEIGESGSHLTISKDDERSRKGQEEPGPRSMPDTHTTVSEALCSASDVVEIIDKTLASGVIVAEKWGKTKQNPVKTYEIPTLAASLSSMQISDISSMRKMKKRRPESSSRNASHWSVSLRSNSLPAFESLFYGSISSQSTSHGRRRKKAKESGSRSENDGRSNGLGMPFRFS